MNDRERIAYLKRIIKEFPNTPKARNAKWLIKEIQEEIAMTIRNPFRNRQTRLIFDACIESANNPSSEFYNRHGGRRSGASHRNYFWHGVTSIEKPELLKIDYGKSHGTMAYVCFRAGQEWAKAQRND